MRFIIVLLIIFIYGCSSAELRREFFDISISDIEKAKEKYTKVCNMDTASCYKEVGKLLKEYEARIASQDEGKHFIVAYYFQKKFIQCIDTTEVAFLIKSEGDNKSRLEIFSYNYMLAELVSKEFFEKIK